MSGAEEVFCRFGKTALHRQPQPHHTLPNWPRPILLMICYDPPIIKGIHFIQARPAGDMIMSDEESQIFRGDRPVEEAEKVVAVPAKPKTAPPSALSRNSLPAGEPVGDAADTEASTESVAALMPEIEPGPVNLEAEPEPPYNFDIDPDSLWTMPEAMQERLSNLNANVAVIHRQLDDQERDTARIAKALRALNQ